MILGKMLFQNAHIIKYTFLIFLGEEAGNLPVIRHLCYDTFVNSGRLAAGKCKGEIRMADRRKKIGRSFVLLIAAGELLYILPPR